MGKEGNWSHLEGKHQEEKERGRAERWEREIRRVTRLRRKVRWKDRLRTGGGESGEEREKQFKGGGRPGG